MLKDPSKDEVLRQMNTIPVNLPPDTKRWAARRKAMIINAVHSGAMSLEEVCRYYALSVEEFVTRQRAIEDPRHPGVAGHSTTDLSRCSSGSTGVAVATSAEYLRSYGRTSELEIPTRALIVAADVITAAGIKVALAEANLICDTTDLGEDGLEIGKLHDYDIILLDLTRRGIQGLEVLRWLHKAGLQTPMLMVSDLAELDHKIKGLGFSADDFLTTPFDRRELVARVRAIARRSKAHSESTIQTGKLLVNLDTRVVTVDDQPVRLTGKAYAILELICLRKGTTSTKEMLLKRLYGGMDEPGLKIIDVLSRKCRKDSTESRRPMGSCCYHCCSTKWGTPIRSIIGSGVFRNRSAGPLRAASSEAPHNRSLISCCSRGAAGTPGKPYHSVEPFCGSKRWVRTPRKDGKDHQAASVSDSL
jgi:two-component system cell cycle response regulator CtrA